MYSINEPVIKNYKRIQFMCIHWCIHCSTKKVTIQESDFIEKQMKCIPLVAEQPPIREKYHQYFSLAIVLHHN